MSFWDASALIPLFLDESKSSFLRKWIDESNVELTVWWGTLIECHSAVLRRHRMGELDEARTKKAHNNLAELSASWTEITPEEAVRSEAFRLIHRHPLKAADGLQLAAAMIWANHRPAGKYFVCLDDQLREVARIEGFLLVPETI